MKSDGAQLRSYCYVLDCASALLTILVKGTSGNAYNISNPQSIVTIKEIAQALASAAGTYVTIENPSDTEKKGFTPMRNSSLNADKLLSLGWKPLFNIEDGAEKTIRILSGTK